MKLVACCPAVDTCSVHRKPSQSRCSYWPTGSANQPAGVPGGAGIGVLKSACKWANENGLMARNPLVGVQRPRVEREPVQPWRIDEAQAFLAKPKGDRLAFAWACS